MYKIIVSDLDETLLNDDKKVSIKNRELINKAREMGVKFVPASGRGYASIQGTLEELGLKDMEDEYTISFNSGVITENKDNKILSLDGLDYERVNELFKKGLEFEDLCIHIYTKDKVYVFNFLEEEKKYLDGRMEVIEFTEPNIEFLKNEDIIKILFMNTDHNYLKSIAKEIKNPEDLEISYSANRYLEFNKKGVNKGSGLKKLTQLLGVDIKDTIAIGDNFNDLSMLELAGLSIGVNNMVDSLKDKVNYITQATNNEDAVAEVIEKFILNNDAMN